MVFLFLPRTVEREPGVRMATGPPGSLGHDLQRDNSYYLLTPPFDGGCIARALFHRGGNAEAEILAASRADGAPAPRSPQAEARREQHGRAAGCQRRNISGRGRLTADWVRCLRRQRVLSPCWSVSLPHEQPQTPVCPKCCAPMTEHTRILIAPGANKYGVVYRCGACDKIKWVDE
jgi:hypothetical protein